MERIDIGGRSLALWRMGEGRPTVVLETGLGAPAADWAEVQERVARRTTVCRYERANCGRSDPAPVPRSSVEVAHDLAR